MTALSADDSAPAYRDPARPVTERVEDLLGRMTWDEKLAQLGSVWVFQLLDGRSVSTTKAGELLSNGIGHVTRVSGASNLGPVAAANVANEIQKYLLENTRLGIPAIVHEEICSGLMASESIVFPQAIGVASTWEPNLAYALAGVVRAQMRAMGAHQGLSPVLDVGRDPRWGRLEETFGEDPHLVASMGVAFVRGLQGEDRSNGVIATAKHFVGYSASDGGLNWAPARIPARELREVYLHPFEAAVRAGGVGSVMNAYHELDGIPCTADAGLLTGVLREEWGFEGTIVSDYFSVRQLTAYHRLARDAAEAAAIALKAGIDVELPSTDCYGDPLTDAANQGLIDGSLVDDAVRRVLRSKFELGLFDRPLVDSNLVQAVVHDPAHISLAREIARSSIILLKNDGVLPLRGDLGSIAVIGPNADNARNLFGDYTYPAHIESLLETHSTVNVFSIPDSDTSGLIPWTRDLPTVFEELGRRVKAEVRHAQGCEVIGGTREGFEEAVALAAASDVVVMVVGDKAGLTDDCTTGEGRDRMSLDLPGHQEDLVREVVATGKPVVLVLVTGRPSGSVEAHDRAAAVVATWLPGEEGAGAIVDVLIGEHNPGGKMPISHPRSAGQIPVFYGHKVSGGRSHWKGDYVDGPASPLYPFGFGLSYSSFQLSGARCTTGEVPWDGSAAVEVTVTNTGQRDGDEVVQVYVRDPEASLTRPVLELKGFARVPVPAGGSRRVSFMLPVSQLGFYDHGLSYVVEPGEIQVWVGRSSDDLIEAGTFQVIPAAKPPGKAFAGTVELS
jgi:beta-glucosidase